MQPRWMNIFSNDYFFYICFNYLQSKLICVESIRGEEKVIDFLN